MKSKATRVLLSPIAISIFTLIIMVSGGWVGDIIKGDCLSLGDWYHCDSEKFDGAGLVASLILFSIGAAGLITATREYLPARQLRAQQLLNGHKGLIITVSTFGQDASISEDGRLVLKKDHQSMVISGDIEADIEALDPLKVNTQQFLRAVSKHVKSNATHIVLLGSRGEKGSGILRSRYAGLLKQYLPNADIDISQPVVDFENLQETQQLITQVCDQLVKSCKLKYDDIMIDVTGGTKTASIAAALATLHRPELQFQYVGTEKPYQIMAFNVVSETPAKVG